MENQLKTNLTETQNLKQQLFNNQTEEGQQVSKLQFQIKAFREENENLTK